MKLHRLVLRDYRGITHREIEFPDRGVVVISGANEIGKSSMIEALDLLLEAKDRSTKKEVKQVKPTHADVGAEITAEISTGVYRFVYRKRFHKRCETELTIVAPRREQLSGDEAHDRVRAMLDETLDVALWQAQRVLQSGSTAVVDLSDCDALSRALDVAAGESVELSGAEPLLIDRIDTEFGRYFTPTGRPTGEWAAVTNRLRDANDAVARCAAAVGEVDDAVRRHAQLTEQVKRLAEERDLAAARLATNRAAADAVAVLARQLKEFEVVAGAAKDTHAASVAALTERRRLRAEIDERAAGIGELERAAAVAVEDEATAREVHEAADAAAEQTRTAVADCQARTDDARSAAQAVSDRAEADRLTGRIAKIDAAQRDVDRVDRELMQIAITDARMQAIETAVRAVESASVQVELASAHIELTAAADLELMVAGQPVALTAGATWSTATTATTEIELPGQLRARVAPGTPASDTQAKLEAAQRDLAAALDTAQVADVAAARDAERRRRELTAGRDRLRATLEALMADDDVAELRARLAELREGEPAEAGLWDAEPADAAGARAELDAAVAAHRQAIADCETHRKAAALALKRAGDKATAARVLQEKLTAARTELATTRERLAAQRELVDDEALAVKAQADGEEARRTAGRVAELSGELAAAAPAEVAAALDEAVGAADAVGRQHQDAADALREVITQLKVYGTEGRQGQLDAAETERQHADAEYLRVGRRARAAQLLRSVMARHRDATRLRYVEPFRREVERLGRLVFGDSFEVEIDSSLRIRSRTVAGCTVPYESLSGGAKEQLGIVARLAGAALVGKDDSVPVIIDDALGFTDADRLTKMGSVFDAVGGDGQVIVLTCSAERYAAVGAAQHIELSG